MPNSIHYPQTTLEERMQLFNLWEVTNNVTTACATLKLSRATFYYWKDTFITGGYQALAQDPALREAQPAQIPQPLADEILALKAAHPHWGKWQILRALKVTHPFDEYANVETVRYVLGAAALL